MLLRSIVGRPLHAVSSIRPIGVVASSSPCVLPCSSIITPLSCASSSSLLSSSSSMFVRTFAKAAVADKKKTDKNKDRGAKKSTDHQSIPMSARVPPFQCHVMITANNALFNVTDSIGGTIMATTCGRSGFKGRTRATPAAVQVAAEFLARKMLARGITEAEVRLKGAGAARKGAVKGLVKAGVAVTKLIECTPIPHNGCTPPKRRRK